MQKDLFKNNLKTVNVYCNKCGKEIKQNNGILQEDILKISKQWGYFSDKDGREDSFCICEDCYDEIVKDFTVGIKTKEKTEFV